ncbi:MAG TPA: portal protein, partial [Actinomycetota bacterium]|nr:portal protein [Actinomycetota bacterium]
GLPVLEDGRQVEVRNVIWSTGFRLDFSWIDMAVFDTTGILLHERGVVPAEPGLCFMGLPFQYSVTSETVPGMGRDAAHIARHIAARVGDGSRVEAIAEAAR